MYKNGRNITDKEEAFMPKQSTLELYEQVFALEVNNRTMERGTTAVLILPGGGIGLGPTRLTEPQWQRYADDLWIGGTRGDPAYTREEIVMYVARERKLPTRLEMQGFARHTPDQMEWATDTLQDEIFINNLIVSTAKYHTPRCVLTFVKTWMKRGDSRKLRLGILPSSNPRQVLKTATNQTIVGELERIEKYQANGDVATAKEFREFLSKNS